MAAAFAALALDPLWSAHSANNASSLQTVNGYAGLADLALDAPMVVEAEIRKTYRIKAKESPGIPAGYGRYLVTAEVVRLISGRDALPRSEEHTSELQSLMRISYAVFCLKKKKN